MHSTCLCPLFRSLSLQRWREDCSGASQKKENANLVLRGKIKGHGFQGREGPVILKNKYGTCKQQCATKIVRRNRRCITQYSYSGNLLWLYRWLVKLGIFSPLSFQQWKTNWVILISQPGERDSRLIFLKNLCSFFSHWPPPPNWKGVLPLLRGTPSNIFRGVKKQISSKNSSVFLYYL